jgi:hypothetical protein
VDLRVGVKHFRDARKNLVGRFVEGVAVFLEPDLLVDLDPTVAQFGVRSGRRVWSRRVRFGRGGLGRLGGWRSRCGLRRSGLRASARRRKHNAD